MYDDTFSELTIIIPTFYPGPIINNCIDSLPLQSDLIIVDTGEDEELERIIIGKKNNLRHFKTNSKFKTYTFYILFQFDT